MRGQRLREMGNDLSIVPCAHNPGVVSELPAGRGVALASSLAFSEWQECTGRYLLCCRTPGGLSLWVTGLDPGDRRLE